MIGSREAWRDNVPASLDGWGEVLLEGGTRNEPARLVDGRAGSPVGSEAGDCRWMVPAGEHAAAMRAALQSFLAGFGVGAVQGGHLVERLLTGACARRGVEPEQDPAECALLHAEETFEAWLSAVLGAEQLDGQPALPVGRAAFLACGGPTAWPHLILEDQLPKAFVTAMRTATPVLAPMPMPGTMVAQSLEPWSVAEAGRALGEVLDANIGWLPQARPLLTVPIRIGRSDS